MAIQYNLFVRGGLRAYFVFGTHGEADVVMGYTVLPWKHVCSALNLHWHFLSWFEGARLVVALLPHLASVDIQILFVLLYQLEVALHANNLGDAPVPIEWTSHQMSFQRQQGMVDSYLLLGLLEFGQLVVCFGVAHDSWGFGLVTIIIISKERPKWAEQLREPIGPVVITQSLSYLL